jgi:hypothetical protein
MPYNVIMRTIETNLTVVSTGKGILELPADVAPGQHKAVVMLEDPQPQRPDELRLPVYDTAPWPEDLSLRREDLYGDDGR